MDGTICSLTYCVYVLCDPRKRGCFVYGDYSFEYEPFYVGKGKRRPGSDYCRRPSTHIAEAKRCGGKNSHKTNKIMNILESNNTPISIIYKEFGDEESAYILEELMINTIGKRIDDDGPLTNIIDGGTGGCSCRKLTEDQIDIRRKNITHWWKNASEEDRQNHSKRISDAKKGRKASEEKLLDLKRYREEYWKSDSNRASRGIMYSGSNNPNAKYVYDVYVEGLFKKQYSTLIDFCVDNGFPKSRKSHIRECIIKKDGVYKHYRIIRKTK